MNRRLPFALTFCLYPALLLAIAGGCKKEAAAGAASKRIVVIPKGNTHEHWKGVQAGAEQAGREFGYEITFKGPPKEDDRAGQINLVEQFASEKVAGICLAPLDKQDLLPPVRQAVAKKIPVLIFDSGLDGQQGKDFISLVATDNKKGGYLGGKELARLLDGKGKVVLLRYQQNSASTEERETGFMDAMKENPGIQVISDNQYAGEDAEKAQRKAEQMIDVLRQADGIFCANESSTQGMLTALEGARPPLVGAGQKLKFVGFDKSVDLVKALEAGKIQALVAQNPEKMGYESVKAMVDHLNGKPPPAVIDTGVLVITPQNIGSDEVKKLLHR
jgi:ribose transport system substrate-binding protein